MTMPNPFLKLVYSNWKQHGVALSLLANFSALVLFSRSAYSDHLIGFFSIISVSYLIVFGFGLYLWHSGKSVSAPFVLTWAVVFHILGLFGQPLFEDDYFRYLWDAYHTIHWGSPYGVAPSDYFSDGSIPYRFQAILGHINYPDTPTIYGPILQYSFLLSYAIAPGDVWALQLVYSFADLLLIAVLLKLAPPRLVLLYAWSPLVFKEVILTAHPDGIGVLFLMLAILFHQRQRMYGCAVLLAISVAAKVFALLFVPFLLLRARLIHGFLFLATLGLLYGPLLVSGEGGLAGLSAMAQNWEFNSAIYGLLTAWVPAFFAKAALALVVIGFLACYLWRYRQTQVSIVRGDWVIGIFLLCSPVINPWYLLWALPFATIYPSRTLWVASAVILMAYITGLNLDNATSMGPYDQPIWVRPLEFGIVLLAALVDWRQGRLTHVNLNPTQHTERVVR